MTKSMTGYGKVTANLPDKNITIEIRTLNSKQLDINLKLPGKYREKEALIRNLASSMLERGKIDISIYIENISDESSYTINKSLAQAYYSELYSLSKEIGREEFKDYLPLLIRLPEVVKAEREQLSEEEWLLLKEHLIACMKLVNEFRTDEGKALEKDILNRISLIQEYTLKIEAFESARIKKIRERILSELKELKMNQGIDNNRFEQEMIYYLEKMDITEEKVRLNKHCSYFFKTMNEQKSAGKKLNFIAQEIGREINTIGSKANDSDIQEIVVNMKDELEKIKEQLYNIL